MYNAEKRFITTSRLILREFTLSDAENVSQLCNNYNVSKGCLGLPFPYPLEKALNWIPTHKEKFDTDQAYEFAITDKDSGILYGAICLFNNQMHKNGEIGYWIGEDYWGQGYATEAVEGVTILLFPIKTYIKFVGDILNLIQLLVVY